MGEFTDKVAAAHSLRSTKVIKSKLEHIAAHFEEVDNFIYTEAMDLIGKVEEFEEELDAVRTGL